jgi:hypothetical protein
MVISNVMLIDCTLFQAESHFVVGICFCDNSGGQRQLGFHLLVLCQCEATALLISLQMAATCGYESVSFESDSQTIVKALMYRSPNENE